ncbi:uncharacterized protein LOC110452236 [Mizuhopecten yessoensis]|uniref:Complement C1q tumor necrosis factor-related protein 2 n=1 Tax=Mizuhopecten yessoensis TaxID=6573 RepID=A0A210QJZ2_MIZYE|nr:uncharacterized protein LOC110452236 [Mizuhopecten yessoensis]OWF49073.1 Complement C1q tumor necrosis factor-related protein 2 [Mizuhopecten yessoensis]
MDWLYFVFVLTLATRGTAEESPVEKAGTYTSQADVRNGDRTASSNAPLRHFVESLMERVELQEIRLQQMEKTIEENIEDLKRKDIRIGHLERELDEIKTASYQIQPPVDERQQSEAQDHDINPDSPLEQTKSKINGITSRQKTKDEQPRRSARVSPANSGEVGAFSVSLSKNQDLHPNFVLTFDEVLLDIGGNYNKADGVYIVPVSGVYVFTWITTGESTANVVTELVINGSPRGRIFSDPDAAHWDSSTGLIVTSASVGDHVFIRSKYSGNLHSDNIYSNAMFSGWRLS